MPHDRSRRWRRSLWRRYERRQCRGQCARARHGVQVRRVDADGENRRGKRRRDSAPAGWNVSGVAKASVDDIKTGDFVGIASVPTAEGGDGALEVVIFPAALKGRGEGSRPWDLKPNSTMTNG